LFRSGEHAQATPEDLQLMQDMGIRSFVDLRGSSERERAPCQRYQPFDGHVIVGDGETAEMAPHIEAAQALEAEAARRTLRNRYATLPFRPVLMRLYGQYMRMLAETDHPSVVYCSAGKDRTGLLVALLHTMLGVHPDDVMHDYLLTNAVSDNERRIEALRRELTKRFGSLSDEAIRVVLSVEPSYLTSAFDAIRERSNSFENYLEYGLGVTSELRKAISAKLIA
jgi:protein tyrosine/serine phosphatase